MRRAWSLSTVLLAGCFPVTQVRGLEPARAPIPLAEVEVLEAPPSVAFRERGELQVLDHAEWGPTDPSVPYVELRKAASERGCRSVLIKSKGGARVEAGGEVHRQTRRIRAVCVEYLPSAL